MTPTRPLWQWCLLGAIAMSLGWGLRGSIGGGSLGAMIPGAMIGLVLCLLLNRHSDAGILKAHWTRDDFVMMLNQRLAFTPLDAELIREGIAGSCRNSGNTE